MCGLAVRLCQNRTGAQRIERAFAENLCGVLSGEPERKNDSLKYHCFLYWANS